MKTPTICEDCEKVFWGGPYAFFCPKCRKKRLSAAAKRRNLNKLGNDAYSEQRAIVKDEKRNELKKERSDSKTIVDVATKYFGIDDEGGER